MTETGPLAPGALRDKEDASSGTRCGGEAGGEGYPGDRIELASYVADGGETDWWRKPEPGEAGGEG